MSGRGVGGKGSGSPDHERMFKFPKKSPHVCRHDRSAYVQKGGFAILSDIVSSFRIPEYSRLSVTVADLSSIIKCAGGNRKNRCGMANLKVGQMTSGLRNVTSVEMERRRVISQFRPNLDGWFVARHSVMLKIFAEWAFFGLEDYVYT